MSIEHLHLVLNWGRPIHCIKYDYTGSRTTSHGTLPPGQFPTRRLPTIGQLPTRTIPHKDNFPPGQLPTRTTGQSCALIFIPTPLYKFCHNFIYLSCVGVPPPPPPLQPGPPAERLFQD